MSASPRVLDPPAILLRRALVEFEVPLTRYAVSILRDIERARDAVQDTFVKLYAQEPKKVEVQLKSWLFTVCRNRCYDILKKEKRMIPVDEERINSVPVTTDDPAQAMRRAEEKQEISKRLQQLLEMIEELPSRQREVMRLKFQADMSYKEIGEAIGITTSNVGFIVHSAVKRLRQCMTDS